MVTTHPFTLDDLLAMGPEVPFEVIGGERREVSPTWTKSSVIAGRIFFAIYAFVTPRRLGIVTVADGGYILGREPLVMLAPDVGFVRQDRIPAGFEGEGFFPGPPDLAVEVESASDRSGAVQGKIDAYLEAGVPLVWRVRPRQRRIEVSRPGLPVAEVKAAGLLEGGDVLPGFRLPVADIFA